MKMILASILTINTVLCSDAGILTSPSPQTWTNQSTVYLPTNTAPLNVTLNPLTSGVLYTNSNQRAEVTMGISFNAVGQEVWLTNLTSHQNRDLKSGSGVNQSASMLISPNDIILMTNINGTPPTELSDISGL